MSYLIITNCTGRKSLKPTANLQKPPRVTKTKNIESAANDWSEKIISTTQKIKAKTLYQGRTIVDTKFVQEWLHADVFVISAGLGLVSFEDTVPSYELTVNAESQFSKTLKKMGYNNQDWWEILNKLLNKNSKPIARLLKKNNYKRILISLPSSYLDMIGNDLWSAEPNQLEKILLFTSPFGTKFIPNEWQHLGLPYDDRLEDRKSGYSGTRSDFPQRAMKHFACEIKMPNGSLKKIITQVNNKLAKLEKPTLPPRVKVSDPQLIKLINKYWRKCHGQTSKLLRFLRDEALISCEQTRFQKLCAQVRKAHNENSK